MKNKISTEIGHTNIVAIDNGSRRQRNFKFAKEIDNLIKLSNSRSHNVIFNLSRGMSNIFLFLGSPADRIGTKEDKISSGRSAIINIANPVSISKGMNS